MAEWSSTVDLATGRRSGHARHSAQGLLQVLCEQEEMIGVRRGGLKAEPEVEGPGSSALGVGEQGPAPDEFASLQVPQAGILQQGGTEPPTLLALVDGQSGQQDDGHGVTWQALGNPARSVLQANRPCGKAGIPDDFMARDCRRLRVLIPSVDGHVFARIPLTSGVEAGACRG